MSVLCALSGAAYFSIGHGVAIAGEADSPNLFAGEPQVQVQTPRSDQDPELGILRVRDLELRPPQSSADSELGTLRLRELEVQPTQTDTADSALGTLRVQDGREVKPPQFQPRAYLLGQVSYFQTNNIFSGVDPVEGGLISSGLTLWTIPALGPKTNLVAAIEGSLIRYIEQSEFSYNQVRFRAGIRQRLTSRMYSEVGWNNQQLFRAGEGDRFLNENSILFALYRRDRLTSRLRFDSFYEFRFSNANPESRSRFINALSLSLSYYIQRNLQISLNYQYGLVNFTQIEREDQYHRLLTRLNYAVSRGSNIIVQSGLTLGGSSNQNINFDNFFFSFTYAVELGRF